MAFVITFLAAFSAYLVFTAGSWNKEEMIAGVVLSLITAIITTGFHFRNKKISFNPLRVVFFIFYLIFPFFIEMAKANVEVAIRVITGKIRPGMIRYNPKTKSDFATMMIANSITLTPGSLTVEVDEKSNELYVHLINIKPDDEKKQLWEGKDLFSFFDLSAWIRRIAE